MVTLLQFSRNIRKRGSQVENAGTRVTQQVAKRALRTLVLNTPVDTGKARSNWRVGIGAPTSAEIDPYVPGRKLGIGERANAAATIAAGNRRIDTSSPGRGNRLGLAIYISNNVRYIDKLNSGSSLQHPGGFIDMAILESRLALRTFRVFK